MRLQGLPSPVRATGGGLTPVRDTSPVAILDKDIIQPAKPTKGELLRRAAKYQPRAGRVAARAAQAQTKAPPRPRHKISDLSEQRVLKTGLRRLHARLVLPKASEILELPRREDGSCRLMRQSFFQRLLSKEIELQGSMPNDIASAQSDLRHLSLEQLLGVRARTLDFATESRTHDAHNSFLAILDRHLFERIASRHLRGGTAPRAPELMQRLGVRLAIVLGARAVLLGGSHGLEVGGEEGGGVEGEREAEQEQIGRGDQPPVPTCWALPLEDEGWDGVRLALFSTGDLQVDLLRGEEEQEIAAAAAGRPVAVVWDRSTGLGRDRVLHWEVAAVDPSSGEVLSELSRAKRGSSKAGTSQMAKDVAQELRAALARRSAGCIDLAADGPETLDTQSRQGQPEGGQADAPRAAGGAEANAFGPRRMPSGGTWDLGRQQPGAAGRRTARAATAPVQFFNLALDDSDAEEAEAASDAARPLAAAPPAEDAAGRAAAGPAGEGDVPAAPAPEGPSAAAPPAADDAAGAAAQLAGGEAAEAPALQGRPAAALPAADDAAGAAAELAAGGEAPVAPALPAVPAVPAFPAAVPERAHSPAMPRVPAPCSTQLRCSTAGQRPRATPSTFHQAASSFRAAARFRAGARRSGHMPARGGGWGSDSAPMPPLPVVVAGPRRASAEPLPPPRFGPADVAAAGTPPGPACVAGPRACR
uniref:Uncharacterized protein n=1 Tax=Alexandrium monilatum TaxID=311494 RepID=A0A7S4VQB5_9DINO